MFAIGLIVLLHVAVIAGIIGLPNAVAPVDPMMAVTKTIAEGTMA